MLVEIDLLDYLAYQMGCGILSDLRLFQQSERLHRLTAAIPLGACSEQEWLDAMVHNDLPGLVRLLDEGRKRKEEVDGR